MFVLDAEQWLKLNSWLKETNKKTAALQWAIPEIRKHMLDEHTTYGGAIGGSLTYSFTPTSLGMIVKVRDALSKQEIDLTNYDEW